MYSQLNTEAVVGLKEKKGQTPYPAVSVVYPYLLRGTTTATAPLDKEFFMQKFVCIPLMKAEDEINKLLGDGWEIIPQTTYTVPGVPVYAKNADPTKPAEKRSIHYHTCFLSKPR